MSCRKGKGPAQRQLCQPLNLPGQQDCPQGGRERPDSLQTHYWGVGLWCQESSDYGGQSWHTTITLHPPATAGCTAGASSTGAPGNWCIARTAETSGFWPVRAKSAEENISR